MKKTICWWFVLALLASEAASAITWHPVEGNLLTRWSQQVDPKSPLPEYPRPQMVRSQWQNLNGLWTYAITRKDAPAPQALRDHILVPYPAESALSGVGKPLLPDQNLWYERTFGRPSLKRGERVLLHFGAVDFEATVYLNGREVGRHAGGYQSFSLDITDALKAGRNTLRVKVWDPTETGPNPHGKQILKPHGVFYTATSGIWQTVWLETVPSVYIAGVTLIPDVDTQTLSLEVQTGSAVGDAYAIEVSTGAFTARGRPNEPLSLRIPNARLWSPEDPFLYDLQVRLLKSGAVVDSVRSYFGMRKVALQKDAKGHLRIYLNDRYTYNLGVLDQGFWPDGLYTAPTDEALRSDIATIKSMGFNTIRKHIKIEPDRWYFHCDQLGMLVWQDMVQPGGPIEALLEPGGPNPQARAEFEAEVKENLAQLQNHPSITTWVLFNEGWGAYDPDRLESLMHTLDPSRLLDGHSGLVLLMKGTTVVLAGTIGSNSQLADIHSYPNPGIWQGLQNSDKASVLGEFGGIGVFIKDHMWRNPELKSWGYEDSAAADAPTRYTNLMKSVRELEQDGLTASIYTQAFDVEGEQNGLVTYDREVMKIARDEIRKINAKVVRVP